MARSQTNTARIDGLRPGMVYVVQVRARTVAGYGKFSGKMCFQTLTDGKGQAGEALVTAEMPAANWIPVELPRKGLPLGGPAFTRQSICLKPGRVFDIWWVFLRRSLYRARAEAPTCTPASAEQGAQHKIKGHALLGF